MFSTAKKTQYCSTASTASTVKMLRSVLILFGICTTTRRGSSDPCKFPFYATHCHFFMLPVSAVFIQPCRTLSSPFLPSSLEVSPSLSFSDPCLILFSLYVTPVSSEQVRFRKENPGNSAKTMVLVQPLPSPLSICPLASPISL